MLCWMLSYSFVLQLQQRVVLTSIYQKTYTLATIGILLRRNTIIINLRLNTITSAMEILQTYNPTGNLQTVSDTLTQWGWEKRPFANQADDRIRPTEIAPIDSIESSLWRFACQLDRFRPCLLGEYFIGNGSETSDTDKGWQSVRAIVLFAVLYATADIQPELYALQPKWHKLNLVYSPFTKVCSI